MKRRYYFISIIALLALCASILFYLKKDTWFHNLPETAYSYETAPDRIVLLPGEDFGTSRVITWKCDSVLKPSFVELSGKDTVWIEAAGEIVESRAGKSAFYKAFLNGLQPDEVYRYRAVTGADSSAWYSFKMPAKTNKLSFIEIGDVQDTLGGITGSLFNSVNRRFPDVDFWAFAGDVIERPMDSYWNYWTAGMDTILQTKPIFAATGNHEYLKGMPKVLDSRWTYTFAFPENGPEGFEHSTYFVDFDDLRYIVIDTDGIQGPVSLYRHYAWLKNTLEKSDKKWNIVMMHHPVYSVRKGRNNYFVRYTLKPLFEKYNVQLVLQGHDHGYSRITTKDENDNKKAPVYIVSYMSPKSYRIGDTKGHDKIAGDIRTYQHIEIEGDSLFYNSYTTDHKLFDRLILLNDGKVIEENIEE